MIEIEKRVVGLKEFFNLFEAAKFGGIINVGKFALIIEPNHPYNGVASIKLVAHGNEINGSVLINMTNKREKAPKKEKKQEIIADDVKVEKADLFDM